MRCRIAKAEDEEMMPAFLRGIRGMKILDPHHFVGAQCKESPMKRDFTHAGWSYPYPTRGKVLVSKPFVETFFKEKEN